MCDERDEREIKKMRRHETGEKKMIEDNYSVIKFVSLTVTILKFLLQ